MRPVAPPVMLRVFRRIAAFCAVLALFAIACRDRGVTGPGLPQSVSLALVPRFQAGAESARPVTRVRAVAYRTDGEGGIDSESAPLASGTFTVDPEDDAWPIALEFATSAP